MDTEAHETFQLSIIAIVIGYFTSSCEDSKRRTRIECVRAGRTPTECRVMELGSP